MSIDSETRSILDKPVPRTIHPLVFFSRQPILTYSRWVATVPVFLQATILLLTFLVMVKPAALPSVDMWDRRCAPAYQWEARVLSKKFR